MRSAPRSVNPPLRRRLSPLATASAYALAALSLMWACDSSDNASPTSSGGATPQAGAEGGALAPDMGPAGGEGGAGVVAGEPAGAGVVAGEPAGAGVVAGEPAGAPGGFEEPPPLEAPILRRSRAFINRQDGGLGIELIGRDEDSNVVGFELEYFYDDGQALQLSEAPGPITRKFNSLVQGNGDFVGKWSVPFLLNSRSDLERLARVQVRVLDDSGYASPVADLELLPTPTAALRDECDVNRGLSRCEDGALCADAAGGRKKCETAVTECPDYYSVVDLNAEGGRYEGDTTGLATYGRGFCGGGTASMLFSFTADVAGQYAFTSQPLSAAEDAPTGPDTLMWIRSHCAFSDWVAELGCNDDINVSLNDLGSRIVLDLTEGQTIYIFIDGYSDPETGMAGWSGQFLLEAVAL